MVSVIVRSLMLAIVISALWAPTASTSAPPEPVTHASAEAKAPVEIRVHYRRVAAGTTNDHTIRVIATHVRLTGTIRIAIGGEFTRPQRTSSAEPGYVTLHPRKCASARFLRIERRPASERSVLVASADCAKWESFTFTYREVSGPTKARSYFWHSVAKVNGAAGYRPVAEQPSVQIAGARPASLEFYDGPATGVAGERLEPFPAFLVHDRYGNSTYYNGYVHLSADGSCPAPTLEGSTSVYPASDGGGWFQVSVDEPCPDVTLTITANRLGHASWGPFPVEP